MLQVDSGNGLVTVGVAKVHVLYRQFAARGADCCLRLGHYSGVAGDGCGAHEC